MDGWMDGWMDGGRELEGGREHDSYYNYNYAITIIIYPSCA